MSSYSFLSSGDSLATTSGFIGTYSILVFPEVAFSHNPPVVLVLSLLYFLVSNLKNLPSCGKNYAWEGVRKFPGIAGTGGGMSAGSLSWVISAVVGAFRTWALPMGSAGKSIFKKPIQSNRKSKTDSVDPNTTCFSPKEIVVALQWSLPLAFPRHTWHSKREVGDKTAFAKTWKVLLEVYWS